jgi:hypothetical protein
VLGDLRRVRDEVGPIVSSPFERWLREAPDGDESAVRPKEPAVEPSVHEFMRHPSERCSLFRMRSTLGAGGCGVRGPIVTAPRIFCIPATRAPVTAAIARGPSDWVRLGKWDLEREEFEHGAWLAGTGGRARSTTAARRGASMVTRF